MTEKLRGAYGADDELVDYILGITYEIWEQRGIELINQYYAADTVVYALDGISRGAAQMIDGTRAMLDSYPDRLLVADDVIWSGDRENGYYSSHRILSPMTNHGPTLFGPATGNKVKILTIADCVVEDGVITREWLIRDNHALVKQLGFDASECARVVAQQRNAESDDWIDSEVQRLCEAGIPQVDSQLPDAKTSPQEFAEQVLANSWSIGDQEQHTAAYAPYVVQRRSPIELYSGRKAVADHLAQLRASFRIDGVTVDHIAVQPADSEGIHLAVRWTAAGTHCGSYLGLAATDKPVFILGSTHWRIEAGKVALEWTIFDGLGVLSQLV